jgi:hypothetical protein
MGRKLHRRAISLGAVASAALLQTASGQPASVTPADVAGMYFVAANGFETRVIHPMWFGDSLVVEDIRSIGNYPLIAANIPAGAIGFRANHPATMVGGILTYATAGLFGASYPQVVVFKRTNDRATGGIHAVITFEGPPEGSPSTVEALTRSETEWKAGQDPSEGDPDAFPG